MVWLLCLLYFPLLKLPLFWPLIDANISNQLPKSHKIACKAYRYDLGATKHCIGLTDRTGRKLPHPNPNPKPNPNPNPSAAAAMLEVVVLGAGGVISCRCSRCGRWGRCGVSSHWYDFSQKRSAGMVSRRPMKSGYTIPVHTVPL